MSFMLFNMEKIYALSLIFIYFSNDTILPDLPVYSPPYGTESTENTFMQRFTINLKFIYSYFKIVIKRSWILFCCDTHVS